MEEFENWYSYLDAVWGNPEMLEIYGKVFDEYPEGWSKHEKHFVPFPKDGFLA